MFLTALPLIIDFTQKIILTEILLVLCTCYRVKCANKLVGRTITIRRRFNNHKSSLIRFGEVFQVK